MSFDFKNKTVLITGASGGIGRRIAQQFDESGACLALHYNSNKEKAQQLLDSLTGSGHFLIQSDLQDPNAIAELSAKTIAKFNKLDILVNNAGIYNPHPVNGVFDTAVHVGFTDGLCGSRLSKNRNKKEGNRALHD